MGNSWSPVRSETTVRLVDSLRATFAGNIATRVAGSAATLFHAGGHRLLNAGTRAALVTAAEQGAAKALSVTSAPMIAAAREAGLSSKLVPSIGGSEVAIAVAGQTARGAARVVLRGAGRAAGIGFVLDGAIASVGATLSVRRGEIDRAAALRHVAKEAASGAVATGAGVLLGAGLVAITGGVAAPAVFAVAAIGSIGAKHMARRVLG